MMLNNSSLGYYIHCQARVHASRMDGCLHPFVRNALISVLLWLYLSPLQISYLQFLPACLLLLVHGRVRLGKHTFGYRRR